MKDTMGTDSEHESAAEPINSGGENGEEMQPPSTNSLQFRIDEHPSWLMCIFLGFQHYLTMFGSTIAVPFILAKGLCIANNPLILGEVINTIFFVSGIATLLQSTVGNRLPIVQGATFSFLAPTSAILSLPQFNCTAGSANAGSNSTMTHDWTIGMLEIQGAIMVASLFQIVVGFSGLIGFISRFIGPLTVAPTISLIGLSLYSAAGDYAGKQWGVSCMTVVLITVFSQFLKNINVPFPWIGPGRKLIFVRLPLFKLFPIILSIVIVWITCAIVTEAGGFSSDRNHPSYKARTDARESVLKNSKWFRLPYPGQWGTPTVSIAGVFGMFAGVLASMIESVGDYYACARLSGAPPPPAHAISRGIGTEGVGCLIAGAFGSGNGTTSYGENIAAIEITKVGSRRVIQFGALFMIILGVLGKFGALFATIPEPLIGGMFWALFGMIISVGLSNLQFVDLNSSRNMFVLGFSFFTGIMVPTWFDKNKTAIDTGILQVDQIFMVLLRTPMAIGCIVALILDNTLSGTAEERGINKWRHIGDVQPNKARSIASIHVYDPPFAKFWINKPWTRYVPFLPYYPQINNQNVESVQVEL